MIYEVPTFVVGAPARQGHWPNPVLTITPGVSHPLVFAWGGKAGEAINLTPFTVRLVIWQNPRFDLQRPEGAIKFDRGETLLIDKVLTVDDPYSGVAHTILNGLEGEQIGAAGMGIGGLRWALLLQNGDHVYAAELGSSGVRSGEVAIDYASGLPAYSVIGNR